jgi:hypothetical protein
MIRMILGLASMALLLTACQSDEQQDDSTQLSSPGETAEIFIQRLKDGDYEAAYDLIAEESQDALAKSGGIEMIARSMEGTNNLFGGFDSLEILSENINGDSAIVNVRVTYGDGTTRTQTSRLVKKEGAWKLVIGM